MADGTVKNFTPTVANLKKAPSFKYNTDLGRNILWYYPFDLILENFTFAYEHILPSGKVSFKIPVSVGLRTPDIYYSGDFRRNNRFGTGLEVNIYPFEPGKLQYFFGPAIQWRTFAAYYTIIKDPMDPFSGNETHEQNVRMFNVALKNGVYYQFSKSFLLSGDIGLGVRFFSRQTTNPNYYAYDRRTRGYIPTNLHLGFRF
jgi:hypothetical protein